MKLVNLIDNADLESPQLFFRTLKSFESVPLLYETLVGSNKEDQDDV